VSIQPTIHNSLRNFPTSLRCILAI